MIFKVFFSFQGLKISFWMLSTLCFSFVIFCFKRAKNSFSSFRVFQTFTVSMKRAKKYYKLIFSLWYQPALKKHSSAYRDTIYTIYLYLCTQSADAKAFWGIACTKRYYFSRKYQYTNAKCSTALQTRS